MRTRANERAFDLLQRFFDALVPRGFRPDVFFCETGVERERDGISRGLRCDPFHALSTMVRVRGHSHEPWHREAVAAIVRGGYVSPPVKRGDTICHRRANTVREASAELRRLEAMDEGRVVPSWGRRNVRLPPPTPRRRTRLPTKLFRTVLAMARRSTLHWDDVVMTFMRRGHFQVVSRRVPFLVAVSVHSEGSHRSTSIYSSIDESTPDACACARRATRRLRAQWSKHRDEWLYFCLDQPSRVEATTRLAERIWTDLSRGSR